MGRFGFASTDDSPLAVFLHRLFIEAEAQSRGLLQHHPATFVFQLAVDQAREGGHLVVPKILHITRIQRGGDQRRMYVVEPRIRFLA